MPPAGRTSSKVSAYYIVGTKIGAYLAPGISIFTYLPHLRSLVPLHFKNIPAQTAPCPYLNSFLPQYGQIYHLSTFIPPCCCAGFTRLLAVPPRYLYPFIQGLGSVHTAVVPVSIVLFFQQCRLAVIFLLQLKL